MNTDASADAEPLLLIGARRRAALREALVACVQSWRREWSAAADPVRVLLAEEVEQAGVRGAQPICLSMRSVAHGKLASLSADHDALAGWLGVVAHTEHGSSGVHAIAREFQVEMLSALCTALARRARIDDSIVESTAHVERPERRGRTLAVTIHPGAARAKTTLLLAPRFIELLLPPRAAVQASAVSRRRHALAEETVQVEAVLGDAEVSLRDLTQLAVGDVIVMELPLRAGGRLTTQDGRTIASIALGRCGDRRAISINKRS